MQAKGSRARLGCFAAVAVVGAIVAVLLVRSGHRDAGPRVAGAHVSNQSSSRAAGQAGDVDRLAFVQPGTTLTFRWSNEDATLRPGLDQEQEQEGIDAWSTETRAMKRDDDVPPDVRLVAPRQGRFETATRQPRQTARPQTQPQTVSLKARLAEIAPAASSRLIARFASAKALWPPNEIVLLAIKDERVVELHARSRGGDWMLVHRYPVLAASGHGGPKLRRGDRQVPEGIYGISYLNPNSAYHVSMRVSYPNAFDRQMASRDGRTELGGDIMIHGKNKSAGCLAMGDEAAEELFVLAAMTGRDSTKVIIAPTDLRQNKPPAVGPDQPAWLPGLYAQLGTAMAEYKPPASTGLLSFFTR